MIIVKNKDPTTLESIGGIEIKELLEYLKMFPNDQFNKTTTELYVICQNYQKQLEMLDYFLLDAVTRLVLINCYLEHIPKFLQLKCLCLNNCVVGSYNNLEELINLHMLTICGGFLSQLPESVRRLTNLEFLNVSNNSLIDLPSWIVELSLTYLAIYDNIIIELQELLPKTLRVLAMHNNRIQVLSPLLAQLPELSCISLHGNPLVFPEYSITKGKTKALLQYLHAFLIDTLPNDTVKVSLVGQERAGKSTLVKCLMSSSGICEDLDSVSKTDGLKISDVALYDIKLRVFDLAGDIEFIETHSMFISEGTLFLAVFDMRTYSLHSCQTNFLGRIEVWLSSIYAQVPNSRVILVGTHADGEMVTPLLLESVWQNLSVVLQNSRKKHVKDFSGSLVSTCLLCKAGALVRTSTDGAAGVVIVNDDTNQLNTLSDADCETTDQLNIPSDADCEPTNQTSGDQFNFPHILGYYEVSNIRQIPRKFISKRNLSIDQLKAGIHSACTDMVALNPVIPRKWFNLHKVILKQVEKQYPIITYQDFSDIARNCGFDDANDELTPFLRHFHSSGELLYYFDIEDLCDIIILDPQWLSNQLRTVVSYRNIPKLDDGTIQHSELENLWSHLEVRYQRKLLSLFRQAGIFIPFTDHSDLIPCRLPIGRPSTDVWSMFASVNENQVDYYFKFNNLPPSFFSHLIALVETKGYDFSGKMRPVYYNNHIVYITKSSGIPCDIHTKQIPSSLNLTTETSPNSDMITGGLGLARFLSLDPGSVESLLDMGRNSFLVSMDCDNRFSAVDINHGEERHGNRHRVHFELLPHKKVITVSIRGLHPCCLAPETIDLLNCIRLTRYDGVKTIFFVLCPICVGKSVPNPSKFSLNEMETEDPVCEKGHDLLSWANVMTGKCVYVPPVTTETIITGLTDIQCPKLFVMIPVNLQGVGFTEFCTLTYLKEGYSVHLLCEYPDCWHFLSSPGYRLSRPKEFVKKYGNRLKSLLRVLSALEVPTRMVSGLYEPLSSIADGIAKLGKFATQLEGHLSDFEEEWTFLNTNSVAEDVKYLQSCDGLQRREFRKFLNKADEEKRFGDLIATFVGGEVLWLCNEHFKLQQVREI